MNIYDILCDHKSVGKRETENLFSKLDLEIGRVMRRLSLAFMITSHAL